MKFLGMNANELRRRIEGINVWRSGDQRAPHKPLLLLYALGRCLRSEPRVVPYEEAVGEHVKRPRYEHET